MNEKIDIKNTEKDERSPIRKREIIKTLLIIFLAGMLILTFFSNTIMNRHLPEISTETVTSGKLTERVRGSGIVESNQAYEVKAEKAMTIAAINIKKGQEIKKGDVLFTLTAESDATLKEAEKALQEAELEYEKALLDTPNSFKEEKKAVKDARAALDAAIKKRDRAYSMQADAAQEKVQYSSDKSEERRLQGIKEKLSATISALDADDLSTAAPEYTNSVASAYNRYMKAADDYSNAYANYTQAVANGAEADIVNSAYNDAEKKRAVRDKESDHYNSIKEALRNNLTDQLMGIEEELEPVSDRVAAYESNMSGEAESYESYVDDVNEKQAALDDAVAALADAQAEDAVTGKKNALDMDAKKKSIEAQRAEIKALKKNTGKVELKAKYDGIVREIIAQPDADVTEGEVLAMVDLADEGYTLKVNGIDPEKARKIKVGVKAEVLNNWSGTTEAILREIKADTTSGSKNKMLVFDVTGEAEAGSQLEISIPCGSGTYDAIVPKSAVRKGDDGDFVLTLKSKNSPLGNRYFAEKVKVDVLAADEVSKAVQGNISQGTYVITESSRSISPGDQVRMKDK